MLGLGARLGRQQKLNGFKTYGPAVIQLDASAPESATASVWKDLKGTADFNATNTVLNNAGTADAYYGLSGTGYFRPDSNPDILANLHKTIPGNQWTIVIAGETFGLDNDWLCGTVPKTGGSDGFGIKWQGDTDLQFSQFTGGATVNTVPSQAKLENNKTFLLIVSFDVNTNTYRIWETSQNTIASTTSWNANTNNADGIFTLGGLISGGEFQGNLYGFMAIPDFIDVNGARSIIDYYNKIHPRTYVPDTLNALFVGQSNMEKLFTDYSGAGATQFETTALTHYAAVNAINGSKGAAAVHYDAAGTAGAYLNTTNNGKGEVYNNNLEPAVTASNIDKENFDVVYLMIGETDSVAVHNNTIGEADHKSAYLTLANLLKTDFPNARIIPVPLMADTNGNEFFGWGKVRRAQFEVLQENAFLNDCPAMYDLSFADDLHLDQSGYETMATRLANVTAAYDGKIAMDGQLGARATAATYDVSGQYIDVTIDHDDGTDFTNSEFRGQAIDVNGTIIAGSSNGTSRIDATTYRVSFPTNSFQSGDAVKVMWPWGTLKNYNRASILIDNAAISLPIRPIFNLDVDEG